MIKSNNSVLPSLQRSSVTLQQISQDVSDNFSTQTRRIKTINDTFREMILAAQRLIFLLWGYQQQQENIDLEHKLQMQNRDSTPTYLN